MTTPAGAHVEIIDSATDLDTGAPLMPDRVLVNGTDVGLITEGGLRIEPGDANSVATVTITLMPRRIEIRPANPFTVVDGKILSGE